MSTRASAARYARALFDVALQEGSLDQANNDLTTLTDLLQQHPDLQRVLVSAAVPAARKRGAVQALLPLLSLSTPVGKLLLMLAERDRLMLIPDMVAVFRERYREHQQIVEAEVTTAMPLAPEREAELRQQLAKVTGRRVNLTTKVDPEIIGGIVTKIGTIVYDGSLASQLTKMRERLVAQR